MNYDEYLEDAEIQKGLEKGTLFQGVIRVNQFNRKRAYVTVNGISIDVMVEGLYQQNRCLEGDTVVISLVDPAKWLELENNAGKLNAEAAGNLQGYTNNKAVEIRIIDGEETKNIISEKIKPLEEDVDDGFQDVDSDSEDSSDNSDKEEIEQAFEKAEKHFDRGGDSSEDQASEHKSAYQVKKQKQAENLKIQK